MRADGVYRAGWRPNVGWACAAGVWTLFVVRPILPWIFQAWQAAAKGQPIPGMVKPDATELLMLLGALLGSGGIRMIEKLKGQP